MPPEAAELSVIDWPLSMLGDGGIIVPAVSAKLTVSDMFPTLPPLFMSPV